MARKGPKPRPIINRFMEKTAIRASGCVEWVASINSAGYGTFSVSGGRTTVAHRWSYEHYVGPIPPGLQIDHLCKNRRCVSPAHLEPVTLAENHARASSISYLNAQKTACPAGHPYSGENLYVHEKTGNRQCRRCIYNRNAARSQRERGLNVESK